MGRPSRYSPELRERAIRLHVEGLLEDKQPIPPSTSFAEYVVVPA